MLLMAQFRDPIDILRKAVRDLKKSINPTIKTTFDKYKSIIVHYNADIQMYEKGQTSKGSLIRPPYRPSTIRIKKRKGQPTDRVTLRDTGRFHKTLKVDAYNDYVEISSDIEYAKYLFKKYGDDVLGIQKELLKEFVKKYILNELKKVFYDKLTKP